MMTIQPSAHPTMCQLKNTAADLIQASFAYQRRGEANGRLYHDFSLSVAKGSILVVMGSSGSGKSTLGKLLAGILTPDAGRIVHSADFARKADVVYVDQHPMNTVFPWQKVRVNIEYPLRKLQWAKQAIAQRVERMLEIFRLTHLANARPATLSGGELQRLALARTFAWQPKMAVLDESLSALDRNTKQAVIGAIHEVAVKENMTLVLITHNISDAIALGTRFIIVSGRPVEIVSDFETSAGFPRNETDPACVALQDELLEVIRHGLL